jgi:alpha-ketoglutarate-dependent taurine dioxygenase
MPTIEHHERSPGEAGLPFVVEPRRGRDASLDTLVAWAREHRSHLLGTLGLHGAVLLRGFEALDGAESFGRVIDALCPDLMDYIGGTAPRTVVSGHILTSTDLPPPFTLALHQEMAYTAHPPEAVAFFCERVADEGGQTTVADAREVTRRLDPGLRARFAQRGLRVRRTLPNLASLAQRPGIPKSWESVFQTEDPRQVDTIAAERGWEIEWLPNGSLMMWQEPLPAFRTHAASGASVWFNQAHYHTPLCTLLWAQRDGREADTEAIERAMRERPEMLDHCFHHDGEPVDDGDARHIWHTLREAERPLDWHAGDLLLLDNVLAMHGRLAYRGQRRVLAALVRTVTP